MQVTLPKAASVRTSRLLRSASAVTLAAVMATATAGCDSSRIDDDIHPRLTDHTRRHPIVVVAETATLDVAAHPQGAGSDARAYVETTRFVRNYRTEGRGPLKIEVPRHGGGAVSRRVQDVRLAAYRAGIGSQQIKVVSGGHGGAIRLSYDRIAAIGPTCGDWSEDVTRNPHNLPYPNYGCASQRNLAAMTATPTDLMFPANEAPRGSATRATDAKNFQTGVGKGLQVGAK